MKKKKFSKKKEKYVVMDEFRKYKNEPHPKYVGEKRGDQLLFLSTTHKPPKGKEKDYIELEKNPDAADGRRSFISTIVDSDHYGLFGARQKDMKLSDSDKKRVKRIFRKNKKGKS